MRFWIKTVSLTIVLSLAIGDVKSIAQTIRLDDDVQQEVCKAMQFDLTLRSLEAIEAIPDRVVQQGKRQIIEWFNAHTQLEVPLIKGRGVLDCGIAIGELILMNAIPVAKMAKIKKYVKALGGSLEAAKLLVGATYAREKLALVSALLAELSGFNDVLKKCS